jgi:hypothetical protein
MESWTVQLLTILGVAVGATASFVSTRLVDRARWRREEALRWDSKRLDGYGEFAATIKHFITTSQRICTGLGLPGTGQPLDSSLGLPALAALEEDLSVKWEQILMLGSPNTIKAAQAWRHSAWHLEWFARGLRNDHTEYTQTNLDARSARQSFYTAIRADLGVSRDAIPDLTWPPLWLEE